MLALFLVLRRLGLLRAFGRIHWPKPSLQVVRYPAAHARSRSYVKWFHAGMESPAIRAPKKPALLFREVFPCRCRTGKTGMGRGCCAQKTNTGAGGVYRLFGQAHPAAGFSRYREDLCFSAPRGQGSLFRRSAGEGSLCHFHQPGCPGDERAHPALLPRQ